MKSPKQKAGSQEIALGQVGQQKLDFAKRFSGARDYFDATAKRDDTKLFKGRANADIANKLGAATARSTAGSVIKNKISALGDVRSVARNATAGALNTAALRGVVNKDKNISAVSRFGLADSADGSRVSSKLAQTEFQNLAQAQQLAQEKNANLVGGITALGTATAQHFSDKMANKRSDDAYNKFLDAQKSGFTGTFDEFSKFGFTDAKGNVFKADEASTLEQILGAI